MDETDLAILREMFFNRTFQVGGADPRVSAAQIAQRIPLPATTVVRRLRDWRRSGFFNGYNVFPNPSLLGMGITGQLIEFESDQAREAILGLIPTLDNVVQWWEIGTGVLWLGYLDRGIESAVRGAVRLSRVPGCQVSLIHHRLPLPECDIPLTRTDWRIVQAVRNSPSGNSLGVAGRTGLNPRTVRRRYDRMMDHRALLSTPRLDHSKTSGTFATIHVLLDDPAAAPRAWELVHRLGRVILPVSYWGAKDLVWDLVPDSEWECFVGFFVVLRSPAEAAELVRSFAGVPRVQRTLVEFPSRWWDSPGRFDREIAIRATSPRDGLGAEGTPTPQRTS